jgi:outer membrane protein TolC
MEIDEGEAVRLALARRLDLRTAIGRVVDAQRKTAVAADRLRADLALLGRGAAGESRSLGSAGEDDAKLDASEGRYGASLLLDLPLERTAERNRYRTSLLDFERAVRSVQDLEDQVKLQVRDELRTLMGSRETVAIQATAVEVARWRLDSTTMFLEAGRAAIRDVLEAEESLVSAQNALSAALVAYRVGELRLQRDMGVLEVDGKGLWEEYGPVNLGDQDR